ncbi:MAG: hypothetical protein HGA45_02940 [Chloroflexales bacterium]|nr:hypothetical protein [Chloroflexales bacterium]
MAAVEQYTRALTAASTLAIPSPPALYLARGQAYETLGDFEQARANYEQALHLARVAGDAIATWQSMLDLGQARPQRLLLYRPGPALRGRGRARRRPLPDTAGDPFVVPFVFSANGRPYLKQLESESGIWFRDVRRPTHHRRAIVDWPTPDGLTAMLEIDVAAAHADLAARPIAFAFPLRPYQRRAIEVVEAQLAEGQREVLLNLEDPSVGTISTSRCLLTNLKCYVVVKDETTLYITIGQRCVTA